MFLSSSPGISPSNKNSFSFFDSSLSSSSSSSLFSFGTTFVNIVCSLWTFLIGSFFFISSSCLGFFFGFFLFSFFGLGIPKKVCVGCLSNWNNSSGFFLGDSSSISSSSEETEGVFGFKW